VKQQALDNSFYKNYVLSTDKKSTALIVETVARILAAPEQGNDAVPGFGEFEDEADTGGAGLTHYITADEKAEVNAAIIDVMVKYQADNFKVTFSGGSVVVDVFNKATGNDTTRLVKIMLLLVGNLKLGLLSMCPNLLPIVMVMGLISLCGISLDINTLFIGSIAIGLVVDGTIHFMYNFRKYLDETGNPKQAIRETFLGTGRALLITSIVLSMNFFVLLTATLNHSVRFGFFTGIVIIFALLSDFLLAPALLFLGTKNNGKPFGKKRHKPLLKLHELSQ